MSRRVPDDATLRRIFEDDRDLTTRQILVKHQWPVVLHTVRQHRRRLTRLTGIEGAASMSDKEFAAAVKAAQAKRFDSRI